MKAQGVRETGVSQRAQGEEKWTLRALHLSDDLRLLSVGYEAQEEEPIGRSALCL